MMKVVCCLLQLALLMTTLQPAPAISRRRPNIIFILADDLGVKEHQRKETFTLLFMVYKEFQV